MKKALVWALVAVLTAVACSKDSTGPSTPVATLVVVTSPQTNITVNGSVQLAATVFDQKGKAIQTATVQWQSLQPQVATVTAAGLATGVAIGTATIRATSGGVSGSVTITVNADPCTTPLSLQVGEVRQLSGPAAVACVTLAPTTGPADFLFVTANANQTIDDLGFYNVTLPQVSAQATGPSAPLSSLASASSPDYAAAVEANIREQERLLTPRFARLRAGALLNVIPGEASAATVPAEGSTVTYHVPNVNATDLCTSYTDVQAVVKKVSAHAVIVQDANAPAGGFTQTDFDQLAAEWESLIFPTDTLFFGGPTDRNADGHVTILYTNEVNRATASGSSSFIAGFFWGGDLVLKTEYQRLGKSCPQTNEQEIFYMLVPDPTGTINGNVRTVSLVRQNTRGTLAHEFQHMINQGIRLLSPAVDSSETVWLNESLSHFAEEIVGRALRGFGDFQNLSFADINPTPAQQDDYLAFFRQNLLRLRPWMLRPDTASPISNKAKSQLAPRGVGWMFLRYLTDQFSSNNAKAYLRHLVSGPDIGLRNLVQWSGGAQFDDMLRGFLVSQYADELGIPGLGAQYSVRSWNLRDVMPPQNGGVYPLLVTNLPTTVSTQSLSGSGNYFLLSRVSPAPATTFHMIAPGGSPVSFAGARVYVVRIK